MHVGYPNCFAFFFLHLKDSEKSHFKRALLEIENRLKYSHEKEIAEREARAIESIKTNPKAFINPKCVVIK